MRSSRLKNSNAVILDRDGLFVDSLGRVVSRGRVLRTVDGTITRSFDLPRLQADLAAEECSLAFLAPGDRLPKSQVQGRESLYRRLDQS
jgi:hypothetical protein